MDMEKIKDLKKKIGNNAIITGALTGIILSVPTIVFADPSVGGVSTVVTSSFQKVVSDTLESIAAIAPIAITIFAATFVWRYAKKFFSTIAK